MEAEALQQGVTDDAMVVERCGGVRVRMIYGSYENLKVTTPEDLILARRFCQPAEAERNCSFWQTDRLRQLLLRNLQID